MISTQIKLFDAMSPVLANIVSSVDALINSLEACEKSSENMIDANALNRAKEAISAAKSESSMYGEALKTVARGASDAHYNISTLTDSLFNNSNVMDRALSTAKKLAFGFLSFQGIKKFIENADNLQDVSTRLDMVAANFKEKENDLSGAELIARIRKSANESRGEFMMTADVIGKLGMQAKSAFGSSDELILFAEQLNKNFKISGTSAEGIASTMYNLTQALSSGVLRGQDLNAIMSNAPIILEKVAGYMGTNISQIRKLAEEGKLTSDVIVKAMLSSANKTDEAFRKMPLTFRDIMTRIKNEIEKALSSAYVKWEALLNMPQMKKAISAIIDIISALASTIADIISFIVTVFEPVIDLIGRFPGLLEAAAFAFGVFEAATWGANAAMTAFNIACNANPIILIITLVVTLIFLLYKWIESIGGIELAWFKLCLALNKAAEWIGVTLGGFIGLIASLALGAIQLVLHAVQAILNIILEAVNLVIKAINLIPGVSVPLVPKVNFAGDFDKWSGGAREKMTKFLIDDTIDFRENINKNLEAKIKQKEDEIAKAKAAQNANPLKDKRDEIQKELDRLKKELETTNKGIDKTAGHAGNIDKKLDENIKVDSDDLKEIRDVMFQRAIQNLSWDKIEVHVDNSFGDVHETADADQVAKTIEDGLYEAINKVGVMT